MGLCTLSTVDVDEHGNEIESVFTYIDQCSILSAANTACRYSKQKELKDKVIVLRAVHSVGNNELCRFKNGCKEH